MSHHGPPDSVPQHEPPDFVPPNYAPQQPYPQQGYPGYYAQPPFPQPGDPGTLDQPYYGIGFTAAVKRAFQKYARFDGRASRSEYWWYALFNTIIVVVLYGPAMVLLSISPSDAMGDMRTDTWQFAIFLVLIVLLGIFVLASIVPGISIQMRRLHDQDLTGWLVLVNLVPQAGGIISLILAAMPTKPSGAHYDRFDAGSSGGQPLGGRRI